MIVKIVSAAVLAVCVWGVLDRRIQTRTAGTVALSLIGLLALVNFL
ncbi:hypothetical protein [Massilia sp. TSP1-1-2]